jgi:uncharacterized DUF497 family protein
VSDFVWDSTNIGHLGKHNVTPAEFEQAMTLETEDLGFEVENGEERFNSAGITAGGRLLFLVWTMRAEKVRAVTAFDAPYSVRKEWEERK